MATGGPERLRAAPRVQGNGRGREANGVGKSPAFGRRSRRRPAGAALPFRRRRPAGAALVPAPEAGGRRPRSGAGGLRTPPSRSGAGGRRTPPSRSGAGGLRTPPSFRRRRRERVVWNRSRSRARCRSSSRASASRAPRGNQTRAGERPAEGSKVGPTRRPVPRAGRATPSRSSRARGRCDYSTSTRAPRTRSRSSCRSSRRRRAGTRAPRPRRPRTAPLVRAGLGIPERRPRKIFDKDGRAARRPPRPFLDVRRDVGRAHPQVAPLRAALADADDDVVRAALAVVAPVAALSKASLAPHLDRLLPPIAREAGRAEPTARPDVPPRARAAAPPRPPRGDFRGAGVAAPHAPRIRPRRRGPF